MLGPLEAWHDSAPVPLGDQQQRFILVVLLLHANRPVSAERLTEIVWQDNPERRSLVRGYINKLRNAFRDAGDVAIETTATGYLLRVSEEQIDTARFDRLRTEALQEEDPRRAIELLHAAVDLWRGLFLEDIDIDRVGGSEVISPNDSYLDAVGDLAELELSAGHHRSARDRLRRVVRKDPARQKHAELLMRALIANGDRVEAIRVFQSASEALAEFGVEPDAALRNLAARAERGEPVSSLSSRPGGFTGRTTELGEITTVAADGRRAVWVSGAPGVGKTGLAIEAAHRLRDRFPDGQLLVRLNGFTPHTAAVTVGDALSQVLSELGVPAEQIPASIGRKATLYRRQLDGTRTLIVLDNAASSDQVRPLLPEAPGCFAIVTSRRVGEPDTGEQIRLTPLAADDATQLFRTLVGPLRIHGRSAQVAAVVKRCGYLPTPIKVVAALFRRHDRWPLDHLLRLLEESGPWHADTDDMAGAAAVRVSYQQLDTAQRKMFRLLGHAPGPHLTVAGAAALIDRDVTQARVILDYLHEVCLLEELAPERYQMLDPLKEFAAAEPSPTTPTERSDSLLRLLDFYLVTLVGAVSTAYPFDRALLPTVDRSCRVSPTFTGQDAALAWIAAERDNLVAAIHHAAAHGLPGHAWRLAVLTWRYFNTTNQFEDWIETTELARRIVSADADNDYGQAHVLLRLAIAHDRLGRLDAALELARNALPKWTRLGDVRGEAATLCAIAIPAMELGMHDEVVRSLEDALAKYAQCDDRRGQAHVLSMFGYFNELRGNLGTALRQHLSAVPMLREIGHTQGLAHALNNLGSVRQQLGMLTEALADHTEAHRLAGEIGDNCVLAYALTNIGTVHRLAGRFADAVRYQEQALSVATKVSDADLHTRLHRDRGATAQAQSDLAGAHHFYSTALDLATETGNRTHQAHAAWGVAQTLHSLDKHTDAVPHWDTAETRFIALGQPGAEEVRSARAVLTCRCRATTY
ncbi:AfsR/SARP family transcriptional regulator [Kibdelosporangium phytohabitans]|uniref:SARP family transcriptional regulator n=2 Tax=Kibdelosporangium phytohabitans TaxID=860235 RepID=A0A0N9HSI2_9PSEU|nr:BTAD domain-containing putative transcriptional regulator [Kibdelosporangium phytohabitans]ALG06197.1 SARP family transcriptional regulator [Kibdelosporangium phytohabitans]MBE1465704.1 DNA-binding SARP family transcriptional activator [Kibdelosporangium phytohabitans]